jgi:hypothetical protein
MRLIFKKLLSYSNVGRKNKKKEKVDGRLD